MALPRRTAYKIYFGIALVLTILSTRIPVEVETYEDLSRVGLGAPMKFVSQDLSILEYRIEVHEYPVELRLLSPQEYPVVDFLTIPAVINLLVFFAPLVLIDRAFRKVLRS